MARPAQTYATHRRWFPLHHYFVSPILGLNAVVAIAAAVRAPTVERIWLAVVALALFGLVIAARMQSLAVQNRLIRLETLLRLRDVLPPDTRGAAESLRTSQLLGLRFAPDDELPDLVRRCAAGELKNAGEVKRAIRSWRGDYLPRV